MNTKYDYSKSNDRAKIICAACKLGDVIVAGARHFDKVMCAQIDAMPDMRWATAEQGFIDQFGNFYDREEAMIQAKKMNQPIDIESGCGGDAEVLFSEGLY